MANINEIISDQACRMRGRAVAYDGDRTPDEVGVAELFDRAESNLRRARVNWLNKDNVAAIRDITDTCNLSAIAVDQMEKGK